MCSALKALKLPVSAEGATHNLIRAFSARGEFSAFLRNAGPNTVGV
jgi:hypothetical protein